MAYSAKIATRNALADPDLLGVKLGRLCIHAGVPAADASERLGVTKSTYYKWICGDADVNKHLRALVQEYCNRLQADVQCR